MSTLFTNARIWDEHKNFLPGELWVDEGAFVHPDQRAAEKVDLQGGWVVPALWDSHLHLLLLARSLGQLDLTDCRDKSELLERLQQAEGEWVEGFGWNESHWMHPELPQLEELDRAWGGRPCWLTRSDLHSGLTNGEGLIRAKIGANPAQSLE